MKKIISILSIIILLSISLNVNAQIVIEGKQIKKSQNVQFEGQSVYVPQKCKIVSVEGTKTSFSLRIDNYTKYQFYFAEGTYNPPTYSVIIEPGMYKLYPDLPPNFDSVFVRIKLESIN